MPPGGFLAYLQQLLASGQISPQQIGDVVGFGGDQTGSGRPQDGGMPVDTWLRLQMLNPLRRGYDFTRPYGQGPLLVPRTYSPANEAMNALPPGLLSNG